MAVPKYRALHQETPPRALLAYVAMSVWKFDKNGKLINSYDTHLHTYGVAVDVNGNVIVGGDRHLVSGNAPIGVWKLVNTLGRLIVSLPTLFRVRGVATDDLGNYFFASQLTFGMVEKYNSDNQLCWQYSDTGVKHGVTVDSYGYVYVAGAPGGGGIGTLIKIHPFDGERIWDSGPLRPAFGIALGSSGNVFSAHDRAAPHIEDDSVYKHDNDGNYVNKHDTGGDANAIAVDIYGNVYVAGARVGGVSVWKLDNALNNILGTFDTGGAADGIAVENEHWTSLDGYVASPWTNIRKTSDEGDVPTPETYAHRTKPAGAWTEWLERTFIIPRRCNKLKIFARTEIEIDAFLEAEIYYSGAWHSCINTSDFQSMWKEESFSTALIEKIRTRLKCGAGGSPVWHRVYEVMLFETVNICVAGDRVSSKSVRKFNSAGGLMWSADTGNDAKGITVDDNGNVFVVGFRAVPP